MANAAATTDETKSPMPKTWGQVFKVDTPNAICKVYTAYDPKTDQFSAAYRMMNRQGQILKSGSFHVALAPIKRDVMKVLSNRVGWSLKGALKSATKLGTKVATMRTLRNIKKIMEDPRFIAAAGVVYPPLGVNIAVIKKGSALLDAARAGNPQAVAAVASINAKAYTGDPAALKIRKTLRALYLAKSAGVNVDAKVEGWLYEKKYRTPLQAGVLDPRKSAGGVLRYLFSNGIETEKKVQPVSLFDLFKK